MNNNPPSPLAQPPQPDPSHSASWLATEQLQQSCSPAPAYNPQWTVPQPSSPPPPEQSTLYINYDYGLEWQRQQLEYQYHAPPPVAQPPPRAARPGHNLYQPTTGYPQHYVPQPVASPQPQLAYYPHLQQQQQQQQKRLLDTPMPHLMPEKRQRFDRPNLNRRAQHHAPLSPQAQFEPPLPLAQNTGVYSDQNEGPGHGDGRGTRGGSMFENRGEMAGRSRDGSYMGPDGGGRRGGQSGVGVRTHGSGGNFGGAASMQAGGRNAISTSAEPGAVPVAAQLQGAYGVNISGNTRFTNIGMNTGNMTTVYNYGGTHGLEILENFVSFAALHDSAEQDPDRRCHPGTRDTVLRQLRDWFDNPDPTDRIIWLHGPAGAGKSAIAQTIAHEYQEQGLAATFFFYRSDAERNDGNRLFPTIAWQLAFSIPAIKDFIVHVLDKTPHLPRKDVESQFEQLVAHPFRALNSVASQVPQFASFVIIDGVDECSDEQLQRRILNVIGNAVKNCSVPLCFLICSRPEALIEETLDQFEDSTLRINLATLDDSHRDIEKYLVDQFSAIASKRSLDSTWPGQEIIQKIVFESSGNFILPSTLVRFISDEDYSPESQLDIVLKLKPHGKISPFALLDELYLEVLRRPSDQDFLKTFLALLVGRSSIEQDDLHEDDATLMGNFEKDLHTKLRKMRSLLKFEPFVDVYHKSFLDFLQDSSRSGQYHVSKQAGLKRYLELVVDSVVQHVSMAIEQPNRHETCRFSPKFKSIVEDYPPKIVLPVEDWQDALKPLLVLQDKLLNTSMPKPCRVTQVMRDLLLHLVLLQRKSHHIAATHVPESNTNETVTGRISAPVTEATQNTDLDSCLSALLSCLQKTNTIMVVDGAIIDHMSSLLAFYYAETAARVRSVSDAQKLIDLIDLLTNNESFLSQCGPDAARKAVRLASKIYARVPILPLSPFLNRPVRHSAFLGFTLEFICQNVLISKILDHNYIFPVLEIYDKLDELHGSFGNVNEQTEPIHGWLKRSRPNFITRIRVMLEIARIIRYIHSMDIVLYSDDIIDVTSRKRLFLDSNLRAKFMFRGLFAWWSREASIYGHEDKDLVTRCTYEANISAFADLFDKVCFDGHDENTPNRLVDDARQLIEQCRAEDSKSGPTMQDVVKEMEDWNLT